MKFCFARMDIFQGMYLLYGSIFIWCAALFMSLIGIFLLQNGHGDTCLDSIKPKAHSGENSL